MRMVSIECGIQSEGNLCLIDWVMLFRKNGLDWERRDQDVGITVSEKGWDSQMICFNSIVKIDKKYHMFYNGNMHGIDGFGHAISD